MQFGLRLEKKTMRTAVILLLLSFTSVQFSFGQEDIDIESDISQVTVFLRGAQVERSAKKFLSSGVYNVVFPGLAQNVDANSVQVSAKGDLTILSVSSRRSFEKPKEGSKLVQSIRDSIKVTWDEIELNKEMRTVLDDERSMILTNKKIQYGQTSGFSVEDIEDLSEFYRTRLAAIAKEKLKIKNDLELLNKEWNRLKGKLNNLQQGGRNTSEIVVEVAVNANTPGTFNFKYLVRDAGWSAAYDVRANEVGKPITLDYNGKVYQRTGVDWNKVKLTLSTSNPYVSANKPNLSPWYLRIMPQISISHRAKLSNRSFDMAAGAPAAEDDMEEVEIAEEEPRADGAYKFTTLTESQVNMAFAIELPYNIPSDGKVHTVNVKKVDLESDYQYYSAPKVNQNAFLMSKVKGWEEHNLISGPANVYFEGTYVGKSYIDAKNVEDELDLSLGIDKQVVVKRERIKDFAEKKVVGSSRKETIGLQITVKNTKRRPVKVKIEDQIPVTTTKEIVVELVEAEGATKDDRRGFLSWEFELKPGESKKVQFVYSVKYPKDMKINL